MHTHMHAHTDMHKRTQARARTHTGPQKRKDNAKKERDYRAEAAAKLTILYAGAQARPRAASARPSRREGGREGGRAGGSTCDCVRARWRDRLCGAAKAQRRRGEGAAKAR